MKQISIRLDDELHEKLRQLSFKTKLSFNRIFIRILKKEMRRNKK